MECTSQHWFHLRFAFTTLLPSAHHTDWHFPLVSPSRKCKRVDLTESVDRYVVPMASSSSNVVGVHYRVGKKIGEGSFGVIFEGTNLLNNQQVAIKFVRLTAAATL